MTMTPGAVTLGGVTTGLCILAWITVRWWKLDRPAWKPLLPYLGGVAYGMLLILAAGGLLGAVADVALWGANGLGDAALEYGVGGTSPEATRAKQIALSPGGGSVVIVMTVVMAATWRFSKKLPKKDLGLGMLTGICLGLSGGIAGIAAQALAPAVNSIGDSVAGLL